MDGWLVGCLSTFFLHLYVCGVEQGELTGLAQQWQNP